MPETRVDPVLGTVVHVVGTRQTRPNLPSTGCPFCPGGLEAPSRTTCAGSPTGGRRWGRPVRGRALHARARRDVRIARRRRRPQGDRPVGRAHRRARRPRRRRLRARVREPRSGGRCDDRPSARPDLRLRPRARAARRGGSPAGGHRTRRPGARSVVESEDWIAWVPFAPTFPVAIEVAPRTGRPTCRRWTRADRDGLAAILIDVLARLDRLYDRPLPYMMWLNQRPHGRTVRRGIRRRLVQHRDRVAVAARRRAAVHRRRRGGERGVLQPGDPRGRRRDAPGGIAMTLPVDRRAAPLDRPDAAPDQPPADARPAAGRRRRPPVARRRVVVPAVRVARRVPAERRHRADAGSRRRLAHRRGARQLDDAGRPTTCRTTRTSRCRSRARRRSCPSATRPACTGVRSRRAAAGAATASCSTSAAPRACTRCT